MIWEDGTLLTYSWQTLVACQVGNVNASVGIQAYCDIGSP